MHTSSSSPRVSVGMPVYNGEKYIREAIDSILAQTYSDYELVISDNGSTDTTEQICRHYASQDSRIRYIRNEINRGASWNFRYVFELAAGEYFKWLSHDDRCDPRLIETCVHALDANPSAVMACTKLGLVDEVASTITQYQHERHLNSARPHQRYHSILRSSAYALEIHGLMRSQALRHTPLLDSYASSDVALLARLVLLGPIIEIPEFLSYYRLHDSQSINLDRYDRAAWFKPGCNGRLTFPQWRLFRELMLAIRSAQLPIAERVWCYFHLLCWPLWERNWRGLGEDIIVALPPLSTTMAQRAKGIMMSFVRKR